MGAQRSNRQQRAQRQQQQWGGCVYAAETAGAAYPVIAKRINNIEQATAQRKQFQARQRGGSRVSGGAEAIAVVQFAPGGGAMDMLEARP
eukprot:8073423-Lingulodinium_polyedra.AAC.1